MSNSINNRIFYGLGLLAILAFGFILLPYHKASAAPTYVMGHYNADGTYTFGDFVWPDSLDTHNVSNTNYSNNNVSQNNTVANENIDSLAANAVFGFQSSSIYRSIVPSGIIQWTLFAIIILLIIIIARKISGASDKYHASPLKHS